MIAIAWFVAIIVSMIINHHHIITQEYNGIITAGEITYNGIGSIIINVVIMIFISIILSYLSQQHDLSKEDNLLPIQFFLFFQLLTPTLIYQNSIYNLTTLLTLILITLLYSCYQQDNRVVEKSFILSFIISIISVFEAHIIFFLPLFFIGMIQMQAASARSIAAMIVGLITPYWIIWGMGWIDATQIDFSVLSITLQQPVFSWNVVACISVMTIGLFMGMGNLVNALNENIKTRAKNGFINIVSVFTALLMIFDNSRYTMYLPLLNSCVALQACYFFTSRQGRVYNIIFYLLILLLLAYTTWIYFL